MGSLRSLGILTLAQEGVLQECLNKCTVFALQNQDNKANFYTWLRAEVFEELNKPVNAAIVMEWVARLAYDGTGAEAAQVSLAEEHGSEIGSDSSTLVI